MKMTKKCECGSREDAGGIRFKLELTPEGWTLETNGDVCRSELITVLEETKMKVLQNDNEWVDFTFMGDNPLGKELG